MQFKNLVELQHGKKLKAIQTDNAKEFLTFTKFLQNHGVIHRLSCPHTHEQNGSAERKHRHIVETGLTLLANASLPVSFWGEAFETATYLINLLPTAVLKFSSPFQQLYQNKPDYNFLKTFGCACYPLLRPYNAHKLDFRSDLCLFLGYSSQHKGYKCLSKNGKMYISRNVVFDESFFPYLTHFASVSSPSPSPPPSIPCIPLIPKYIPSSTVTHIDHSPADSHSATILSLSTAHESNHDRSPAAAETAPHVTPPSPQDQAPRPKPAPVPQHAMTTRAKAGIFKPKVYTASLLPSSAKKALLDPKWLTAMQEEYHALIRNDTWTLMPLPPGRSAIGCKWVFRVKYNSDGTLNKYKARLVAKGFHQQEGFDFQETFSPVVRQQTIRIVLTIALSNKWHIRQIDFNNAFLNGDLEESVFMTQPEGFIQGGPHLVCKLNKALYGLKQAPRAWFSKLQATLISFGFTSAKCDSSLFVKATTHYTLYVLVYVDDVLITGSSPHAISTLISSLNTKFSLKDLGPIHYFLGIEAKRTKEGGLLLCQTKYIHDLLAKANMTDCKPTTTPMTSGLRLSKEGSEPFEHPTLYRSIVGALQYITITRPEMAFSVNKVCQFLHHPLLSHWLAVKRLLRYLKGTINFGLHLRPSTNFNLYAFCDADWGCDLDDRRSTSGMCIYFGQNLISWSSKKQAVVSHSTTEAEYRSLASTVTELIWLKALLSELHLPPSMIPSIYCDNQSTVLLTANPILHNRSKHFELDLHFVREKVASRQVSVSHIPAHDQAADILTKAIPSTNFPFYRSKLRVEDSPLSLRGVVSVYSERLAIDS